MPSITIKDIPDGLLERLRRRAQEDHRSINREVIYLLDIAVDWKPTDRDGRNSTGEIDRQIEIWERLAGRWDSGLDVEEEIKQIYAARTLGRQVDL